MRLAGVIRPVLPALLGAGVLCGCRASPREVRSADPSGCGGVAPAPVDTAKEREVVDLLNARRRHHGLSALVASPALADAARLHARDMAEDRYLEHDTLDRAHGELVRRCGWADRLSAFDPGASGLAENIAAGARSPREVVDGWMGSAVHRKNVLAPALSEVGVGYWSGGPDHDYWVADFAGGPASGGSGP